MPVHFNNDVGRYLRLGANDVVCVSMQQLGESGGMPPSKILKLDALRLLLRPFLAQNSY